MADSMGAKPNAAQDEHHLQLLSIFHYVVAGMAALFACFPMFHLLFGIVFLLAPESMSGPHGSGPPPLFFGLVFTIIPAMIIVAGWLFALCIFYGGRCIARRSKYRYCLFAAGLSCLFMPIGTVLGVFTIIVLVRPSVKELFESTIYAKYS